MENEIENEIETTGNHPAAAGESAGESEGAGAGAGTLLNTSAENPYSWLPGKFHVKSASGEVDLMASAMKLAESNRHLEKRLGAGENFIPPPKTADEYRIDIPEAFRDWDHAKDAAHQEFKKAMHAVGMNNQQMQAAMDWWFQYAPQMLTANAQVDMQEAEAALKEHWKTPAEYSQNLSGAYRMARIASARAGIDLDAVMASPLGNNPDFIRLLSSLAKDYTEDRAESGQAHQARNDIHALMHTEAYSNPRHPEHELVSRAVRQHFETLHGTGR